MDVIDKPLAVEIEIEREKAAALGVSFLTGIVSGVVPARRASGLDPIEALRAE